MFPKGFVFGRYLKFDHVRTETFRDGKIDKNDFCKLSLI